MKKRALRKEFHTEIRKSLNRFLSIFFIVALGVSFYSGIQSSAPDMRATGDYYFDESNLMDIRVISTLGLTEEDIEAIRGVEGVSCVAAAYMEDVYCGDEEQQDVLHVESLTEEINLLVAAEGEIPSRAGECFLDASYAEQMGYEPGDVLAISVDSEEDSTLKRREFVIRGYGYSPCYISFERGSTTLGTGSVSGFVYVLEEDFDAEVYGTAYVTVEGALEQTSYTREYDQLVEAVYDRVEEIQGARCEIRYNEVVTEGETKLEEARAELEEGKQELEDAKQELEDGKAEAESELEAAESELTEGESELEEGKQELEEAREEVEEGESELAAGEQEISDMESPLASARAQIEAARNQLLSGESEYQSGLEEYESSLDSATEQLEEAQSQVDAGEAKLQEGWNEYNDSLSALEAGEATLAAAEQQLSAGQAEYDAAYAETKPQLDAGMAAYEEAAARLAGERQSYEAGVAGLAAKQQEYDGARAQLDAAWQQYYGGKQQSDEALASLNARIAELEAVCSRPSQLEQEANSLRSEAAALQSEIASLEAELQALEAAQGGAGEETPEENQAETQEGEPQGEAGGGAVDNSARIEELRGLIAEKTAALDAKNMELQGKEQEYAQALEAKTAAEGELGTVRSSLEAEQKTQESLEASRVSLEAQETALAQAKSELDGAGSQLETARQQLEAGEATLAGTKQELDRGYAELEAASSELADAWTELETKKAELAAGRSQLSAAKEELEANARKLEEGQEEIDEGYRQLRSAKSQLDAARRELDLGWAELNSSQSQLADGERQLSDARRTLSDARQQLSDARQEIAEAEQEIAENEQKLEDGWQEYEDGRLEAEQEIADGEQKILEAEQELKDAEEELEEAEKTLSEISYPKWYVDDRSALPENSGFGENADRMSNLARVFPLLFFLVAALISLTTMTRMVEEERTQIGTLKALGYSKGSIASKYIKYALYATIGGSVSGVLIGEKIFPWVIISAYGIMYQHLPKIWIPYNLEYGVFATAFAVVCTLGATVAACRRELKSVPAQLMRPPAPKAGRRVLLERVPFLWRRLGFTWKSTIRNLMRYKKRFLMTVTGIGGCMGLMLVGFGLRDSILDVGARQFEELQVYDAMVVVDTDASAAKQERVDAAVALEEDITASMKFFIQMNDVENEDSDSGKIWSAYLYVPETTENLEELLCFRDRESRTEYALTDGGAIITEKLAKEYEVEPGDTIALRQEDGEAVEIPIAAVCENYLSHYIYMTPGLYRKVFGEEPEYNSILFTCGGEQETAETVGGKLLEEDAVLNITYTESLMDQITHMLGALDLVIVVLIVSAGMLAFVVLYNLNNININERKRELATLKVLGFFDGEVASYVYRENILLTGIGTLLGILIGKLLHAYVITTVEVDACMFGRDIKPASFVYAALFTIVFSIIVNFAMFFKLKKINMVESLKSVE